MNKPPAFQFYPKDFISDGKVATMNMEERGIYITLLSYCWIEGWLPNASSKLKRMCNSPSNWKESWKNVRPCFYRYGNKLYHKRLEKERKKQKEWKEKSRLGGKKSGEARRKKDKKKGGSRVDKPPYKPKTNQKRTKNEHCSLQSSSAYNNNIKERSENLPNPPKKKKTPKYKFSKRHLGEAKYLESAIKETNPKHTIRGKQYLEDWANTFRIMEEKKETSLSEIRVMIDFAMGDPFWHSNILSAGKLREQFGRLWEQAKEKGKVKSNLKIGQRTSDPTPEEREYWKAREEKEKEFKKQGLSEDEIKVKIAKWSHTWEWKK